MVGDAAADRSLRGGQRGLLGADVRRAAAEGAAGLAVQQSSREDVAKDHLRKQRAGVTDRGPGG